VVVVVAVVVVVVVAAVAHNLTLEGSATAIAGAMFSPTSTRCLLFRPPTSMFGNVVINNRYKLCCPIFFSRAVKIMKQLYWHYVFGIRRQLFNKCFHSFQVGDIHFVMNCLIDNHSRYIMFYIIN
jgi:hypothetical protein